MKRHLCPPVTWLVVASPALPAGDTANRGDLWYSLGSYDLADAARFLQASFAARMALDTNTTGNASACHRR